MESYTSFLNHFARKIPAFIALPTSDRQLLLKNNAKLFQEYFTTRYFVADTGINQLEWILGPYEVSISEIDNLKVMDFNIINQFEHLIPASNKPALKMYKYGLDIIKQYFQYPHYHTSLIANFILYNTKFWSIEDQNSLKNKFEIQELESAAKSLIKFGCDEIKLDIGVNCLDQLIQTLVQMSQVKVKQHIPTAKIQETFFANSEIRWIQNPVYYFLNIGINEM